MPNFIEQQHRLSLYSRYCETSAGIFSPFINLDEGKEIIRPCNGLGINIVDCKNPQREEFIKEVDGLDFLTIKATRSAQLSLPQYIPVISGDFFNVDSNLIKYGTIGVSLKDIFTSPPKEYLGRLRVPDLRIKEQILKSPIFRKKRVILFSSGVDVLIEKLWQKSEELDYFKKLSNMGFDLITAINFSVISGECPLGHAINLKKSLQTFYLMEKSGTVAIPHIYWANKFHLSRWLEWLNINTNINLVTINCQRLDKAEYALVREGIKYLIENVDREIRFLLEGPKRKFLESFSEISPVIHVATKSPAYVARNYRKYEYDSDKLKRIKVHGIPRSRLLGLNIKLYDTYLRDKFFKK